MSSMNPLAFLRTRFRFTLGPTLFTVPALAVLIWLGTWQVERLEWKTALIASRQAALTAPPVPAPMHDPMLSIAQLSTWLTSNWALAQPWATQLLTQAKLKLGGLAFRSMHAKAHVTVSMQVFMTVHAPQSAGQLSHVS